LSSLIYYLFSILYTFILIKPDSISRGLVGIIISRFEMKGFKIEIVNYIILGTIMPIILEKLLNNSRRYQFIIM